jgi:hypothetical protein
VIPIEPTSITMGNRPSTHNPELVDTSLDDWYGRKYEGRGATTTYKTSDWAPHNNDERDAPRSSSGRYDEDVRDNSIVARKSNRRPYDKRMTPLVEATAAVFHLNSMDQDDDDDVSVSQRSAAVFDHLEEQAREGNHQPIVTLLETATLVSNMFLGSNSETSEEEEEGDEEGSSASSDFFKRLGSTEIIDVEKLQNGAIFELLDKVKSVDENQVAQFSSAVFQMLETAKSFSAQPPNERKLNIFRLLEENNFLSPTAQTKGPVTDEHYYGSAKYGREDYPEVGSTKLLPRDYNEKHNSFEEEDVSILEVDDSTAKRSIPIQTMEGEPIDLTFVQDFDNAFNEFIGQNPKFLLKSPDLVHNIRIAKLQKLLAYMNAKERNLLTNVAKLKANKQGMEDSYQTLLREAARAKAARQIYFQADLEKVTMISKTLEAKFKWAVVASAEIRTKKHQIMRHQYAEESPDGKRDDLIRRIPRDVAGERLISIIRDDGIPSNMTLTEKADGVRKLQVDIAFLSSEVKIWQRKLEIMEGEKQKVSWIETILQQLTEKQMKKLKGRFQKKTGIQFA